MQRNALVEKLTAAIRQDPKKSGILGFLVLVMVVLWIKVATGGNTPAAGPAGALAAAVTQLQDQPAAESTVKSDNAERAALDQWISQPVTPSGRNLFFIKLDYFPRDGKTVTSDARAEEGFWDQLAKSVTAQADQKRDRQILIDNLRAQAARLKLQSTIMGAVPKALIDGELVGEGDVVAGFRVLKIGARGIVIEREGIVLEILMK
jgi:hypothetical protein